MTIRELVNELISYDPDTRVSIVNVEGMEEIRDNDVVSVDEILEISNVELNDVADVVMIRANSFDS